MLSLLLLVIGKDSRTVSELASALGREFANVKAASSLEQARAEVRQAAPDAVIADLETVQMGGIEWLTRELDLPVICTHRVPDEEMWTAALEAGALDVCPGSDTGGIVAALHRHLLARRQQAA